MSNRYINKPKDSKKNKYIQKSTDIQEEFEQTGNNKFVFVSIKDLQNNYQCFSKWTDKEMAKFWDFNRRIHQMTWQDVYDSASKGENKRGLAYTVIPRENYKSISFIKSLSIDIDMFELRVDDELRVHGYRKLSVFILCILDREHAICKKKR